MKVRSKRKRVRSTQRESSQSIKSINNIINDVVKNDSPSSAILDKKPEKTGVKTKNNNVNTDDIYAQFPTIFRNPHSIMIPTKVKTLIEKYLPKPLLDKIHGGEKTAKNRAVAVELCLFFLFQLSSTHRNIVNGKEREGWKSLRAEYLRQLLWIDDETYQMVENALLHEYKIGSIIERGTYCIGQFSTKFRLGDEFRSKGYLSFVLQTNLVQNLFRKSCTRKLKAAHENVICNNLIEFYKTIELPSKEEILEEAKRLVAIGIPNKKGKILKFLNKKNRSYYKNINKIAFVENAIKSYEYLTTNGLLIPRVCDHRSGGRVVDSFTLMPSWIRKLVKVNGLPMVECDYSCLHPNIAMSLYGGNSKYMTHQSISENTGIDCQIIKMEHLSFFNKRTWSMQQSPLYDYYLNNESSMLHTIISEKNSSEFGHKVTSRRLFQKEVAIMTAVITRLNEQGIYVGYVYDALFCDPKHKDQVNKLMDEVIIEFGVYTTSKID